MYNQATHPSNIEQKCREKHQRSTLWQQVRHENSCRSVYLVARLLSSLARSSSLLDLNCIRCCLRYKGTKPGQTCGSITEKSAAFQDGKQTLETPSPYATTAVMAFTGVHSMQYVTQRHSGEAILKPSLHSNLVRAISLTRTSARHTLSFLYKPNLLPSTTS